MRSYDKVFDSLFKDKITELIFKFLIMSFYLLYEKKKNEVFSSKSS